MSGRAVALLAAATFVAILGGEGTIAGAAPTHRISLSTDVVVPGQRLTITGSGWPNGTVLSVTICGADAVAGTGDCAQTATISMGAGPTGMAFGQMTTALPPEPCPCVILVTGVTANYSEKIPVTVVGAATAPVPPIVETVQPDLQVADLHVVGGTTLASLFGGAAPRKLELRVHNAGSLPETPLLLGRWGSGTQVKDVIAMPIMRALGAGQSAEVRAPFSLPALSMGRYTVRVEVEVVGFPKEVFASTSTSTWPIALFVLLLVLLEVIAFAITRVVRRRRRRPAEGERLASDEEPPSDGSALQPEHENAAAALGAQVPQSGGGTAELSAEHYDPDAPTWQLE